MSASKAARRTDDEKPGKVVPGSSPDETFQEFLEGFGDRGSYVNLYRQNPQHRRLEYCGRLDFTEAFDLDGLRNTWGGGRFQFRVFDAQGKYLGSRMEDVAGSFKDLSTVAEVESPPQREKRRDDELDVLRSRLQDMTFDQRFRELREELVGIVREARTPPPAAAAQDPLVTFVELLKVMRTELAPHAEVPVAAQPGFLEVLRLGLELGREGKADTDTYMPVVERFGLPLLDVLRELTTGRRRPALGAGTESQPAEESQPMTLQGALGQWMPTLLQWADQDKDPALRADLVCEELPVVWRNRLASWIGEQGGSAITTLVGWFPEVQPRREWFMQLLETIHHNLLDDEGDTEEDDDGKDEGPGDEGPTAHGVQIGRRA